MPQREGTAAHEASAAATAASTAFPPSRKICSPALAPASSPMIAPKEVLRLDFLSLAKQAGSPKALTRTNCPARRIIVRREYCCRRGTPVFDPAKSELFRQIAISKNQLEPNDPVKR